MVRTETHTVQVPVYVKPPAALTAPVPEPTLDGSTNGALADYVLALQHALDAANAKLHEIAGIGDATQGA